MSTTKKRKAKLKVAFALVAVPDKYCCDIGIWPSRKKRDRYFAEVHAHSVRKLRRKVRIEYRLLPEKP